MLGAQPVTSQQVLLSGESAGLGKKGNGDHENDYKEQEVISMENMHWETLRKGANNLNIPFPFTVT